jgi:rhomboid protease GluP
VTWLFFLLIVAGIAFYFTTRDERARALQLLRSVALAARDGGLRRRANQAPFFDAVRERTLIPFMTMALLLVNVVLFFEVVSAPGPLDAPSTLIAWGANFGPRTTNGQWWRLIAATFLHDSVLEWLISLACLAQLGFLLERLTGHTAFGVVYFSAGAFASLVSLTVAPVAPNVGSTGALFGVYGLLLSTIFWGSLQRGTATIPWTVLKDFMPFAIVLVLYQVFNGSPGGWVELAGFATGLVWGIVLARGVSTSKPPARRTAVVASAAMVLTLVCTFPLRGITDARPEVNRVIASETRAAEAYRAVVVRFNEGLVPAAAMTRVIDQQILPEIRATRQRLQALTGVPREHQPMVAAAQEYLRLREESWRLRADALQRTSMGTLKKADRTEWESLEALKRVRTGA